MFTLFITLARELYRSLTKNGANMKMIPVSSRAINAIGYSPETSMLKITFKQNKTYDYCSVPQSVFDNLLKSQSKGSYYNDNIRDKYPCY